MFLPQKHWHWVPPSSEVQACHSMDDFGAVELTTYHTPLRALTTHPCIYGFYGSEGCCILMSCTCSYFVALVFRLGKWAPRAGGGGGGGGGGGLGGMHPKSLR